VVLLLLSTILVLIITRTPVLPAVPVAVVSPALPVLLVVTPALIPPAISSITHRGVTTMQRVVTRSIQHILLGYSAAR
jgi:hypothetical protein